MRNLRPLAALILVSFVPGCFGSYAVEGGSDPGVEPAVSQLCGEATPGASPARRLTRAEYNATVAALLGDTTHPADSFVPDPIVGGFDNDAESLTVSSTLADQYLTAAETLASKAVENLSALTHCAAGTSEDACARDFIRDFGKRVYRRPLSDDEQSVLYAAYTTGKDGGTHQEGIELALTAMLSAPQFLYRLEISGSDVVDGQSRVVNLTGYEMATRLSYFLIGSTPDDALLTAAESGELATEEGVRRHVDRLLGLDATRDAVLHMQRQWLGLNAFDNVTKDATAYPQFTTAIRTAMRGEVDAFLRDLMWNQGASLASLFTANYSFRSAELNAFYGDASGGSTTFARTELPADRAAGLLTLGAFTAMTSGAGDVNPVRRGKFVREVLLCQSLPVPPEQISFPTVDPSLTTRERFAQHSADPACAGCHELMDPLGFSFENWDAIGRFVSSEAGKPLDGSSVLTGTDVDGAFRGVPELGQKLAKSTVVQDCVATKWFRYAYGRRETDADKCTLDHLKERLGSAGSLRDLLIALTETDAFRFRTQGDAQ